MYFILLVLEGMDLYNLGLVRKSVPLQACINTSACTFFHLVNTIHSSSKSHNKQQVSPTQKELNYKKEKCCENTPTNARLKKERRKIDTRNLRALVVTESSTIK